MVVDRAALDVVSHCVDKGGDMSEFTDALGARGRDGVGVVDEIEITSKASVLEHVEA